MEKAKKKWYKSWWAITLYVLFSLIFLVSLGGGEKTTIQESLVNNNTQVSKNSEESESDTNDVVEEPVAKQVGSTQPPTEKVEGEPEDIEQPKEKSYQQIFTFSGNGAKKSEPFTIIGDRFKIKYDCSGTLCQAFLQNTKDELDMEIIMNTIDPIKDETIIYGSGEYYIDSNSIGNYTMIVEDYK